MGRKLKVGKIPKSKAKKATKESPENREEKTMSPDDANNDDSGNFVDIDSDKENEKAPPKKKAPAKAKAKKAANKGKKKAKPAAAKKKKAVSKGKKAAPKGPGKKKKQPGNQVDDVESVIDGEPGPKASTPKKKASSPPAKHFDDDFDDPKTLLDFYDSILDWLHGQRDTAASNTEIKLIKQLEDMVRGQKLRLLKEIQIRLEIKAYITFGLVGEYLKRNDFAGLADFFQDRCQDSLDLIFAFGSQNDHESNGGGSLVNDVIASPIDIPDWTTWDDALDTLHEAFKVERDSLQNFGQMVGLAKEDELSEEILEKKDKMVQHFQDLSRLFGGDRGQKKN